ncbi:unnamed protein product [Rhizoctonia solani]|uniref:Uncharacterized protein n=1 Tax=Rhizoctonia solani TaxID=456999 RepID=A0A8H3BE40_9AGAM|nr:unnamed protein product [Rhizoctonia solani]
MNDYSSLFTSGLMLLCDSAHTRSRHTLAEISPADDTKNNGGLRSFLSLDMAESLRTFATGSPSNPPSRAHSRKPSYERRSRPVHSPVASSSKPVKVPVSPAGSRRRSLPQPKPAPLAELPVLPTAQTHSRSRSDSAASQALPALTVISAPKSDTASSIFPEPTNGKSAYRKEHLAPSSLKLELSSAPTTPCSQFPTTPRSSRAISMFSPLTPPTPWFPTIDSASETWSDPFAGALSPTTTESALGLHLPRTLPIIDLESINLENIAPPIHHDRSAAPKRARIRRDRHHSAPSRNASITATSMRSSQASVTTTYRRTQRSGALARLEGRIPVQRSEWMSDEEEAASAKFKRLTLMPSMNFKPESDHVPSLRNRLAPYKSEDQNRSFIDLTDEVASLAQRPAFAA